MQTLDMWAEVTCTWNNRFTRRMGDATVKKIWYPLRKGHIRLSTPLWPRASATEREETIIHEVCHVLAELLAGPSRRVGHGQGWKNLMQRCGVEPKRCHQVDTSGLKRKGKRYPAACACKTWQLGATRHKRLLDWPGKYGCPKCRQPLVLV